jgi:UDP-sugar transporter A1/2/3
VPRIKSNEGMAPFSDDTMARISLVVFTLQNAMFVLLMRGSKLMNTHYNSSVAVLVTEALKLPLSVALLCFEKGGVGAACSQLHKDIVGAPADTLKIAIPAVLYTVQNNALFIAMEHLEAAVFQVTYQLKTLTTAVLTVAMLGRSLGRHQWGALLLLMAGTALVQEPKKDGAKAGDAGASGFAIGVGATVVACVCSSLASVYLEKILTESKPSIWVRNAQLCIFTIPVAWSATRVVDDKFMHEDGNVSAAPPRNSGRAIPGRAIRAAQFGRNSRRNGVTPHPSARCSTASTGWCGRRS